MKGKFQSDKPIYLQIVDQVIQEIVSNKRKKGDKLPSVREFAIDLGVNPNTIQRVYRELESRGMAISRRGQGTFVTEEQEMITKWKEKLKERYIYDFIEAMEALGYSLEEIKENMMDEKWGETRD